MYRRHVDVLFPKQESSEEKHFGFALPLSL